MTWVKEQCTYCLGAGKFTRLDLPSMTKTVIDPCPLCHGKGFTLKEGETK